MKIEQLTMLAKDRILRAAMANNVSNPMIIDELSKVEA